MARIRSVHPGLFTDENFVALSMAARILAIGVWTECDDHGVFEWKPLSLKMRLFPADNVDVAALLAEMVTANVVKKVRVDGKDYGLVRNFNVYQRPKKPNYKFPFIAEWGTYTDPKKSGSEAVENQSPTEVEIVPQMEDGGGEEEEGEKKDIHSAAIAAAESIAIAPKAFEQFWSAYPRREGANPKEPARKKFLGAVRSGIQPETIILAAKQYSVQLGGDVGTRFVAQAVTWLGQQRWGDYSPPSEKQSADQDAIAEAHGYRWSDSNQRYEKIGEAA
jgi:hypothetical protein